MYTLIPLFFISIVFGFAFMYFRVIFMRRHLMLLKVERFLERSDVSESMLHTVNEAFKDAISLTLPITMYKAHNAFNNLSQAEKDAFLISNEEEIAIGSKEMTEIITLMFKINNKITFPLRFCITMIEIIQSTQPNTHNIKTFKHDIEYTDIKTFKHQNQY